MTRIAPPPASNPQGVHDERNVRCGCGYAYNGYRWDECPACRADETGLYAMLCRSCRNPWFASERENLCPDCASGDTLVLVSPEQPVVR